jgi:hypothetical protein
LGGDLDDGFEGSVAGGAFLRGQWGVGIRREQGRPGGCPRFGSTEKPKAKQSLCEAVDILAIAFSAKSDGDNQHL